MRRISLFPLAVVVAVVASFVTLVPSAAPDSQPMISAGSASVVAPASRTRSMRIPVTLSDPSATDVSVVYDVSDGTARRGEDYTSVSGTLTFNATTDTPTPVIQYIRVPVLPNPDLSENRSVVLTLSNPHGATLGMPSAQSMILTDPSDPAATSVNLGDQALYRGNTGGPRVAQIPFTLSQSMSIDVTVDYEMYPVHAGEGVDFAGPTVGTITIPASRRQVSLPIAVYANAQPQFDAGLVVVHVTGVTGGAVIGRANGLLVMRAEVAAPWSPPVVSFWPTPTTQPSTDPTPTTVAPGPSPPSGTLFDDEFDGTTLDASKWQPNWLAGNDTTITKPINGAESSCYDPKQVSVGGGYLHLRADARSCTASNDVTYPYASGLVNSRTRFTFTYGYIEARVWLPGDASGIDNWPAFWADGTGTWPTTGELDVMEGLGGSACYHFHSDAGGPGGCANIGDPSGWHTFGADWRPGSVTYYYDGAKVGTITTGITAAPMYLIANLGVSSSISGPITTPSEMLVDYIRVYP